MKYTNNKKAMTLSLLLSTALMGSSVLAQGNAQSRLEEEIAEQGAQALSRMKMEIGQNAFWKKPAGEQLISQPDAASVAPETAATTDCDQQGISGNNDAIPVTLPVTTEQPG